MPGQCSRLLVAGRVVQWVGWHLGRHQRWRSHAVCLRWFGGWLSEPLRLVGCVVADTVGRARLEAAVMKGRAALDTVAELVGSALPDYMHHSHNPAHRVTSPG